MNEFASAKEMLPTREAKLAMRSPYTVAAAAQPAEGAGDSGAIEREPENELGTAQSAQIYNRLNSELPTAGLPVDPQSEVWRNVSKIQSALASNLGADVASEKSATSLQLALENDKLAEAQKRYLDALAPVGNKDSDVLGYVFAVNGRINSGDIYASNTLFRKLWPRLLKAAATEAIGAEKDLPKAVEPTAAAVDEFLVTAAAGKPSERPLIDGQKLETREAEAALDFATRDASGGIVHRNVLARH